MLAIWLTIVAPVVSRTLPAAADAGCELHAAAALHAGHPGHPHGADDLDCCGYCALPGHAPMLAGTAFALVLAASFAPLRPAAPAARRQSAFPRLGPPPRGPPVSVRS